MYSPVGNSFVSIENSVSFVFENHDFTTIPVELQMYHRVLDLFISCIFIVIKSETGLDTIENGDDFNPS